MGNKKVLSALMALTMVTGMTAVSVSAEEDDEHIIDDAPVAEETQAPEPTQTEAQVTYNDVEEWTETEAPASTEEDIETTTAPDPVQSTDATSTTTVDHPDGDTSTTATTESTDTDTKETTTTSKSTDKVTDDLDAPKIGEFKVYTFEDLNPDEEGAGSYAVISWDAVEGAEGYQVYRIVTLEGYGDIPTSQSFDVKGTSYQTSQSNTPNSEAVRVRAFKIVDGERVYGPWSATKTVYLNGMKAPETTAAKSTTKASTTTTAKTTTTSTDGKTESPKTNDTADLPAAAAAAASALLVGLAVKKRK